MPEGPSIVILKEAVHPFIGKRVVAASGTSKTLDFKRITGKKIVDFKSWGKHFLICFPDFTLKIHLLMFGSYRINERKDALPRLSLLFSRKSELNFYACAITVLEQPLDEIYDWSADVMNKAWDAKKALKKLDAQPGMLICDALLDQEIFAGAGNIIKNEVLFRTRVHPESLIGKLPAAKRKELIREVVHYSFQFLEWKKEFTLKKHWLVHTKTVCPQHHTPLQKQYLGKTNRRTFFCTACQKLYR
jgi:endonuclease-8